MPNPPKQLSDDELAFSMFVFIEQYGERMIRATAKACQMASDKAAKDLDRANQALWNHTSQIVNEAALGFVKDGCPVCGGVYGCWCDDERMKETIRLYCARLDF